MTSIFVAKLDFGVSSEQLKELFEQHGKVLKANVATDRETGKSRGFGFVEMPDANEAKAAIDALDGSIVSGRSIAVKEAEARGDSRGPGARPTNTDSRPARPREDFPSDPSTGGGFISPQTDALKIEPRKKVNKDKKASDYDSEGRLKKPKMDAYKKSGKKEQFFDDDDDDLDDDIFSYKREDEDDFIDEDED